MSDDPHAVDATLRESIELAHYGSQWRRWERVGRLLTERERAETLANFELNVVWDRLDESERDHALEAIQEDRDWPGLFDRMAEEAAESQRESQEQERQANAKLAKTIEELTKANGELVAQIQAEQREKSEQAEREEREAEEERERQAKAERDRLRKGQKDERAKLQTNGAPAR